ncbi:unnamed protein product [Absidia cylindrospora]
MNSQQINNSINDNAVQVDDTEHIIDTNAAMLRSSEMILAQSTKNRPKNTSNAYHAKRKEYKVFENEIDNFLNSRYIGPCKTVWRTFAYLIHHHYPSVPRLDIRLCDVNEQARTYSYPEIHLESKIKTMDAKNKPTNTRYCLSDIHCQSFQHGIIFITPSPCQLWLNHRESMSADYFYELTQNQIDQIYKRSLGDIDLHHQSTGYSPQCHKKQSLISMYNLVLIRKQRINVFSFQFSMFKHRSRRRL